jgi:arsenate reductase
VERVLFICVHNSARSQIAEAYLRKYGAERFQAESAGLEPGTINPLVVEVMKEEGIDLSGKQTSSVFEFFKEGRQYSFVITVCSKEAEQRCPVFPGTHERLHWPFEDPSRFPGNREQKLEKTRAIRDQIKAKVLEFVAEREGS